MGGHPRHVHPTLVGAALGQTQDAKDLMAADLSAWKEPHGDWQQVGGVELDPLYVDAAIRRWQHFTGETAIHATRGNRFDNLDREEGSDGQGR